MTLNAEQREVGISPASRRHAFPLDRSRSLVLFLFALTVAIQAGRHAPFVVALGLAAVICPVIVVVGLVLFRLHDRRQPDA